MLGQKVFTRKLVQVALGYSLTSFRLMCTALWELLGVDSPMIRKHIASLTPGSHAPQLGKRIQNRFGSIFGVWVDPKYSGEGVKTVKCGQ